MDPDPVVKPRGAFHIRGEDEDFDDTVLDMYPELFSIVLNHGGYFTNYPGRDYVNGKQSNIDLLTVERFSNHELQLIRRELGYEDEILTFFHFRKPGSIDLDDGIVSLNDDLGIQELLNFVKNNIRFIDVYLEHGNTNIHPFPGTQSSVYIESGQDGEHSDQRGQEDEDSDGDEDSDQTGQEDEDEDSDYIVDLENQMEENEVDIRDFEFLVEQEDDQVQTESNLDLDVLEMLKTGF